MFFYFVCAYAGFHDTEMYEVQIDKDELWNTEQLNIKQERKKNIFYLDF